MARISCTIPADVLALADRVAAQEQRSRSWVISEALRRYTSAGSAPPRQPQTPAEAAHAGRDLSDARMRSLRLALRLQPAERLAQAEELMAVARATHPRRSGVQIIGFETLDDFTAWKDAQRAQS